jgi:hypothetical protein
MTEKSETGSYNNLSHRKHNNEPSSTNSSSAAIIRDDIVARISAFYERIKGYTADNLNELQPAYLWELYDQLDAIAHENITDPEGEKILTLPDIFIAVNAIRIFYARMVALLETHLAREIIRAPDPPTVLERFPLYHRYEAIARTQGTFNKSASGKLAFIGCGPVPITLILLKRLFDTGSIGIEVKSSTVTMARKCVRQLGMERDIRIIHGDESRLLDYPADRILVAALAEPRLRIFQNLYSLMKGGRRLQVFYRTYTGLRGLLYRPVESDDITGFRTVQTIRPERSNITLGLLELEDRSSEW